jgi:hypothetical protein
MDSTWVTTAFNFEGFKITRNLGVVRGITVRSRSVVGNMVGGLQTIFGGNISIYTELCEQARGEAFDLPRPARRRKGRQRDHRHALRRQRRDGGSSPRFGVRYRCGDRKA